MLCIAGPNLSEDPVDLGHMRTGVFGGDVHNMKNQTGAGNFFQSGAEGLDQSGGQVAHKAYGVAQQDAATGGQLEGANGGIEGGEKSGVGEHAGRAQAVEQSGLSGIGVASQGNHRNRNRGAPVAMQSAGGADFFQVGFQFAYAGFNAAAIGFQFGFAGATCSDAAAEPGERSALAVKARQTVFQLGQFHLQAAFGGAGTAGENIEDELRAIDDPHATEALEVSLLSGGKFVVDDDDRGIGGRGQVAQFSHFTLTKQSGRFGIGTDLKRFACYLCAGAAGQFAKFGKGVRSASGGLSLTALEAREDALFRRLLKGNRRR